MIYLASPYSSPDRLVMKTRFLLAEQCTAHFLRAGDIVFSPIVHCHELANKYQLPTDFNFWKRYCIGMLTKADVFYILDIPGWKESVGVAGELEVARSMLLPCAMVTPDGATQTWLA